MKKIGIITRHCYPNYGSILQTFALESALRILGAEPVVLDYVQSGDRPLGLVSSTLRVSRMNKSIWTRILYRIGQTPTFLSMGITFRRHQRRLLTLTDEVEDGEGLQRVSRDLDLVIAGSDQIWNRITGALDPNYFMEFINTASRRASYAASLGSIKPVDDDVEVFLRAVAKIGNVSVREPSSADWLVSNGIEARSDVDPVLLHKKEFWSNFAGRKIIAKKYILVYQLHHTAEFNMRLSQVEKRHGLPVIRVTPDWKRFRGSGKAKILVSPESFVALIRDADCVVTDSFHGTAFSLRLGTPLYVVPPGKYSTRLLDVVARVGLQRLVVSADLNSPLPDTPAYDADAVHEILDVQASDSWQYLRRITKIDNLY